MSPSNSFTPALTAFNVRCYGFFLSRQNRVMVMREQWRGVYLNKLPGGGLELGEGYFECLGREMEEEFIQAPPMEWELLFSPHWAFSSQFKPHEQLILLYFKGKHRVNEADFELRTDQNLLGIEWLPLEASSSEWFTLDSDRKAFAHLVATLQDGGPQ